MRVTSESVRVRNFGSVWVHVTLEGACCLLTHKCICVGRECSTRLWLAHRSAFLNVDAGVPSPIFVHPALLLTVVSYYPIVPFNNFHDSSNGQVRCNPSP